MSGDRPLRFCLVTTFYPPYHFGGDGVCVYRLAQALARRGHEVDVVHSLDAYRIATHSEPELDFPHHPNVTRHALESRAPRLATLAVQQLGRPGPYGRRLDELLQDGRHDVVHFHNVSLMGGPGVLALGGGLRLYTPHEYWLVCPTHVLYRYGREACTRRTCLRCTLRAGRPPQLWRGTGLRERGTRHVDLFLMPSRFARDRHRADGVDGPMELLPHFVPEPELDTGPDSDPAPDTPSSRPYFLFVGRLEALKGVHDLLQLFAGYREADLVLVGDGRERPALERAARGLDHVHVLGALHPAQLGPLYRNALAVLSPSRCYEVFNLVPVEAFAHGTPAIVRDLGASPELVQQSGAGATFTTLDECRRAMEALRAEPERRAELGRRGRAAYERLWSEQAHMQRYLELVRARLPQGACS